MKLEAFLDTLDRRGGDLASWPDPERRAAEALMAGSDPARRAHRAMVRAEGWLADTRAQIAVPAMAAKAVRTPQAAGGSRLGRRLALGAAAAASLAVGVWTGVAAGPAHEPLDVVSSALAGGGGDVG